MVIKPTDPLWLPVPRALEIVGENIPNPEPSLIAALSGGDVRAMIIGDAMGDKAEPREIPFQDFIGLETLTPSADAIHASVVPVIRDWAHRWKQRHHAPGSPMLGQVAHTHAALYAAHNGLLFVNRDDLAALVARFASEPALTKAATPKASESQAAADQWMRKHVTARGQWKRDSAITACRGATVCTFRQARAAWDVLPDSIRNSRGRPPSAGEKRGQ